MSNVYPGYKICAKTSTFFANHFAILGNSGYGKSCGVARLLQNIFEEREGQVPQNAHIMLFDAYGEYNQAFVQYKNEIIAKCLMDILSSGKNSSQLRDQIIAVLTSYNTPDLNLNTAITQPGYNRTLRQCLNIDDQGKMPALNLVIDELQKYTKVNSEELVPVFDFVYTLEDFYYALEFALISEGSINSQSSYESNNLLKNRVLNLINSEYRRFFTIDRYVSREDFIRELFTADNGENNQLVNINLSNVV